MSIIHNCLQFFGSKHKNQENKSKPSKYVALMLAVALALTSSTQAAKNDTNNGTTNNGTKKALIAAGATVIGGGLLLAALLSDSNSSNSSSSSSSTPSKFTPYVSMQYGGGTIIDIDPNKRMLLIMANEDQSDGEWASEYTQTSAHDGYISSMEGDISSYQTNQISSGNNSATGNNGGEGNTYKIINILGINNAPAAKICASYQGGGFSDWYVPSMWELSRGYDYANHYNLISAIGGGNCTGSKCFNREEYWSSIESTTTFEGYYTYAWSMTFQVSLPGQEQFLVNENNKEDAYGVRCYRSESY